VPIAAALAITAIGAPPAGAATGDTTWGGCYFSTSAPLGSTTNTGVIGDRSVTRDADGLPTGATVSCKIQVGGVDAPGTTFSYSGYGEQAGVDPISFEAQLDERVVKCQRTVYADGTDTGWNCEIEVGDPNLPPQAVIDALNLILGIYDGVFVWDVDPRVCPVLAARPGTYGPVTVAADGDIDITDPLGLGLNAVYDCPPYQSS